MQLASLKNEESDRKKRCHAAVQQPEGSALSVLGLDLMQVRSDGGSPPICASSSATDLFPHILSPMKPLLSVTSVPFLQNITSYDRYRAPLSNSSSPSPQPRPTTSAP